MARFRRNNGRLARRLILESLRASVHHSRKVGLDITDGLGLETTVCVFYTARKLDISIDREPVFSTGHPTGTGRPVLNEASFSTGQYARY